MTLASLLDLGIDKDYLLAELQKINFSGYELVFQNINRHGIQMLDVDVILSAEGNPLKLSRHDENERNLWDINKLIDDSDISENAKQISKKIFNEIAAAEARVHGNSIEKTYFHESGAVDSIVDIVGTAICLDKIGADVVYASPLHDGKGYIECRHGMLPVPVPAVLAMLEGTDIPLIQEDVNTEMITPTGMGIIKCVAEDFVDMPLMRIDKIGYGSGKRETGKFGAVRAILGTMTQQENDYQNCHQKNDKLIILWISQDADSALNMAFMYAKNSKLHEWWNDVDLYIWGPSAVLAVENEKIKEEFKLLRHVGVNLKACVACASRYGVVDELRRLDIEVLPLGPLLSEELKAQTKIITV